MWDNSCAADKEDILSKALKYHPIMDAATLTGFAELETDNVHWQTYKSKMAAMMRIIPWRK